VPVWTSSAGWPPADTIKAVYSGMYSLSGNVEEINSMWKVPVFIAKLRE
jgi:hypothetical protein